VDTDVIIDIVIAVVAVLFLGVYVSWRAGRLDRMHTRLQAARAALDVTLVRRSSVALELASSGFLDPATSLLLASAAHEARGQVRSGSGQPPAERERAERAPAERGRAERAPAERAPAERGRAERERAELAPAELAPAELAPAELALAELAPAEWGPGERPPGELAPYLEPGDELARSELAQSNLSRALRAAFTQPGFRSALEATDGAGELIAEVEAAAQQVFVARKFYNTAVAVTRGARRKPLARLFRLAGNARLPEFFEIDDSLAGDGARNTGADIQHLTG
jgi:hypothetical protein